jgi:Tol biopolymer transport system component
VVVYATWLRNFDSSAPLFDLGVYYRDRAASTTGTVVQPLSGTVPNGTSWPLAVSPDNASSRILYRSTASNLVTGDTLGHADIFLFNRIAGTTERVSVTNAGGQANGPSTNGAISGNVSTGDPRYVAFSSAATNLVTGDTNGKADIFVRDRVAGTTQRVSVGAGGAQADGDSFGVSISDNGRYVAFSSIASNLVPGDTNNTTDVFVRDTVAGTTERVSVGVNGQASGGSAIPNISADGRFVSFDSDADDLVPLDENFATDVFVRDRVAGYTERVSVGSRGEEGFGDSANPSLSRNGRYIAFETDAEEFNPDDANISYDIYVRDRTAKVTQRATEKPNGFEAFGDAYDASISPEGRYVGFFSDSEEFACSGCDSNDDDDVYLKDMGAPWLTQAAGTRFRGITPRLLLDTATGPVPAGWSTGTKLAGGNTLDLTVTGGTTTVPTTATAVVLNVVSSGETANGAEVSVYPTGTTRPPTVALHPQTAGAVSNQVVAKVGTNGQVRFWTNTGATHLRVDVVGYFAPDDGDGYTPVTVPTLLDTRTARRPAGWPIGQKMTAGGAFAQFDLQATGTIGVPEGATAVAVQVGTVDATAAGSRITVRPTGSPDSGVAHVLPQVGSVVSNLVLVPVGSGGRITLSINSGAAHVHVAIAGYFGAGSDSLLFPTNPARAVDTRSANASLAIPGRSGPLAPLELVLVPLAGRAGVPTDARAVALTTSSSSVTSQMSSLIVWPAGVFPVLVSSVNYRVGANVTNSMLSGVLLSGGVGAFNFSSSSAHVFSDVYGYFR